MDRETVRTLVEGVLGRMIAQQRRKVETLAQRLAPDASRDDLLNPQDVANLSRDTQFNYEDGVLAGLLSAQIALRRESADSPDRATAG